VKTAATNPDGQAPEQPPEAGLPARIGFAMLFAAIGLLVVAVFSPYRPMLPDPWDAIGRVALSVLLLAASWCLRRRRARSPYWPILYGLFTMIATVSLVRVVTTFLLDRQILDIETPSGFALMKLAECVAAVAFVLLFSFLAGFRPDSLYLMGGRLRRSLSIGLFALAAASVGSVFIAPVFFGARDLSPPVLLAWLPWILVFVLSNALTEELLYRGVFLKTLAPVYGPFPANLVIAFVFTGLHVGVTYPDNQLLFLALLVPLALAWGAITQKTGNLLASVLFHAGTDVAVILGVFSNLGS